MRPIRFHTTFLQELAFLTLLRRVLRLKRPDQNVMTSPRGLPIWQSLSKRGNLAAGAPQVQSSANTPLMKCLYPSKSLILLGNTAWTNLRVQSLGKRFLS
jgi:hypothetical protein